MHGYKWPINCTRTRIQDLIVGQACAKRIVQPRFLLEIFPVLRRLLPQLFCTYGTGQALYSRINRRTISVVHGFCIVRVPALTPAHIYPPAISDDHVPPGTQTMHD